MDYRVRCPKCQKFATPLVSKTPTNPDRPFWKCTECKLFVDFDDEVKAAQKVYSDTPNAPPSTPGRSQHATEAHNPLNSQLNGSRKRARTSSPPSYQEFESSQTLSPQESQHLTQSSRGDVSSANRLAEIRQALFQPESPAQNSDEGFFNSHAAKAPRLANAPDVHSNARLTADGYATPPNSNMKGRPQLPTTPESPTRYKGKGRDSGSDQDDSPNSQPGSSQTEAFETPWNELKEIYRRSERKRIAAERSAESRLQEIQRLQNKIKDLEERIKKIQDIFSGK